MFREIRGIEDETILSAIHRLPAFYFQGGWADGIRVDFFGLPAGGEEALRITREGGLCRIGFREKIHLFRALGILRENGGKPQMNHTEKMYIPRIGVMIDASRNSVPNPGFLRDVLDRMALMGLNCLILYMEDVYELEGEPRFGYMRGGYTREQLRQLDDYAHQYGISIVASVGHEVLDARFAACTGLCAGWFADTAFLDVVPCSNPENRWPPNPSKYLLWQDPLEGLYDADLRGLGLDAHYGKTARLLEADLEKAGEEGWFLLVPLLLAKSLQLKAALGERLHQHYKDRDREALGKDAEQMRELLDRVKALRTAHRQQWMQTCSPFGWSRLDLRYGGLTARLETAVYRLGQYLDGSLSELPELEAPRYEKDRSGQFLGKGIWKVYEGCATLSDG
nr:hypothetical protein [uncultured Acetatifactor sp.]